MRGSPSRVFSCVSKPEGTPAIFLAEGSLINFPDSIHTWVFFGLLTDLAITTNWFLKEIFAAGEDFESRKARGETDPKKNDDAAPSAAAAVEDKKKSPAAAPLDAAKPVSPKADAKKPTRRARKEE